MSSEKKEEEMYGENAVDGTMENLEPFKTPSHIDLMQKFHEQQQIQNPLGEMIKGLTSMVTGRPPLLSQKLTLSGPVGEGQISIEITDSFSASMAHDIINKVMEEKRGNDKETEKTKKSEQDIFEAMMKDSKKSKILD